MQTAAAPLPRCSLADWSSACITPQTANPLLARRTFVLHFYSLFLTKNWAKVCLPQKNVELCLCRGTGSMRSSIRTLSLLPRGSAAGSGRWREDWCNRSVEHRSDNECFNKQWHLIQSYFFRLKPLLKMMLTFVFVVKYCCRLLIGVEVPIVLQSASGCHRTGSRQMAKG